jgi:hypothetical protein
MRTISWWVGIINEVTNTKDLFLNILRNSFESHHSYVYHPIHTTVWLPWNPMIDTFTLLCLLFNFISTHLLLFHFMQHILFWLRLIFLFLCFSLCLIYFYLFFTFWCICSSLITYSLRLPFIHTPVYILRLAFTFYIPHFTSQTLAIPVLLPHDALHLCHTLWRSTSCLITIPVDSITARMTEDSHYFSLEEMINMAAGYPQKMRFMYNFDAPMVTWPHDTTCCTSPSCSGPELTLFGIVGLHSTSDQ